MPRHPSCALSGLTFSFFILAYIKKVFFYFISFSAHKSFVFYLIYGVSFSIQFSRCLLTRNAIRYALRATLMCFVALLFLRIMLQDASILRILLETALLVIPTMSGIRLVSRAVSSKVPSAAYGLTVVFGMGTGVSHTRIDTGQWRWRDSNS